MYTIRELRSSLKEVLDKVDLEGEAVFSRGRDRYKIVRYEEKKPELPKIIKEIKDILVVSGIASCKETYGCGCKFDGKKLCSKHGRV